MKRYLLSVMLCVAACVSAWAQTDYGDYTITTNQQWTGPDASTEKVAKINIKKAGALNGALETLKGLNYEYQVLYISGLTYDVKTDLSDDDLEALSTIDCATLDLQNLIVASTFTFSNANIKRVILPDYWDKAAVKAAAEEIIRGNTVFEAALSQHGKKDQTTDDAGLVAYVKKPGTLYNAMVHTYFDSRADKKMGNASQSYQSFDKLANVSIMGYPSARDFSSGDLNFGADGHFVFNVEADETSTSANAGMGGVTRALVGNSMPGALKAVNLVSLDLEDAIIEEEHYNDLTISYANIADTRFKEIKFPTYSGLKTIPADCLCSALNSLEEVCIPGNIEYIKTRAFLTGSRMLCHIWTTGTKTLAEGEVDHTVYDNGTYLNSDRTTIDHYGHASLDNTTWNNKVGFDPEKGTPRYGTITLPPNLKLIESHAFMCEHVSDVYSLNETAPECHVDAFTSVMYMGDNTIDPVGIEDGMVTRWSYANSTKQTKWISFLHYPRTSGTPDIQRYTDPTREYSVATTLRDGKGNIIYFPNQAELNRAFLQGTTGYLWYAWDSERVPGPAGNENSFVNANVDGYSEHTNAAQEKANELYLANTMTSPDKTDRSFYDVRLDANGQPTYAKPSDLKWYYETIWEDKQLYPEMETTQTTTVIGKVQKVDEQGHLVYVQGDCNYVQDYTYDEDANGDLVENINIAADGAKVRDYSYEKNDDGDYVWEIIVAEDANGSKVKDYSYEEAAEGEYYQPMVSVAWDTPKPWYKQQTSWVECDESEATHVMPGGWSNSGWVVTYSEWKAYTYETPNHVFVKQSTTWEQTEESNGAYAKGESYATYSTDATDIIPGVNDTRYNKVYKDTYRDYNASTDEGETRYNVTDNGMRTYNATTDDAAGYERYNKVYANTLRDYDSSTDANETRYNVESGYRSFVENADPDSWLQRYSKNYIDYAYREFDSSKDATDETRYCPVMEDVYSVQKGVQNDYRGWHQFILTAYSTNSDEEFTPVKFYQTDNDWWTVCLPYDLKYNDMIKFFGNGPSNIPYLSKLRYVVRDYDQKRITLMFSKNLMVYKEEVADGKVHGDINDVTKYTDAEIAANPVILRAGVPYLIRPNIDVNAGRSFDVYKSSTDDLYDRLKEAEEKDADDLNTYIYNGEYTVPAYVVGTSAPENTQESTTIENKDGYSCTYTSGKITYQGKQVDAKVSSDFTYTFVGSFFLSLMPQYCYFLGWDSSKNKAAFWYNEVPDKANYTWNNQTGIICPNFKTDKTIHKATALSDPARWDLGANDVKSDDLKATGGAKAYGMDWDGSLESVVITGIEETIDSSATQRAADDAVYDLQGVKRAQSLGNLPKGIYIVNGKKYVVK